MVIWQIKKSSNWNFEFYSFAFVLRINIWSKFVLYVVYRWFWNDFYSVWFYLLLPPFFSNCIKVSKLLNPHDCILIIVFDRCILWANSFIAEHRIRYVWNERSKWRKLPLIDKQVRVSIRIDHSPSHNTASNNTWCRGGQCRCCFFLFKARTYA